MPRNYEIYDPLDFLAEVTQHIPNTAQKLKLGYSGNHWNTLSSRTEGDNGNTRFVIMGGIRIKGGESNYHRRRWWLVLGAGGAR